MVPRPGPAPHALRARPGAGRRRAFTRVEYFDGRGDQTRWRTIPFAGLRAAIGLQWPAIAFTVAGFVRQELGGSRCVAVGDRCEPIFGTAGGVAVTAAVNLPSRR